MQKNNIFPVVFFLTIFLNCAFCSNAQLQADFTASVTAGCAPFVVQFTDVSTGNPNEWNWDFGNGTNAIVQNPAAIYKNPGTYNVTLTIKKGASQDMIIKTGYIVVYDNPAVRFNGLPRTGCVPLDVNFSDSSTAGSGSIVNWFWDFGDGSISNMQNPVHTYSTVNTFNVALTVRNTYGCQQLLQQTAFITTKPSVQTDFSYTYNDVCTAPANVAFFDNSLSADSLYLQWYFGDGGASTVQNPAYTYNLPGVYNVTLISKGQTSSCKDTAVRTIILGAPAANFILPKSVCLNTALLFRDSSSPQPLSDRWDFGDGTIARGLNVVHTYASNGTYQVKMTADFGSCTVTQVKTIVVAGNSNAAFTASGSLKSCMLPQSISFTNQSSGATVYEWFFGDGGTSNNTSPVHLYTTAGNYPVTLIATNANGCADTNTQNNLIQLNPVQITGLQNAPFTGCAPKTIFFNPLINTQDPIASYKWSFGDGGSSNQPTPSHLYSNVGSYTVSLIVITQTGCTDTFTLGNAVTLGSRPLISFNANPPDACASSVINFTDLSSGIITTWLWDFGDSTGSTLQNPQHQYADTGYYNVKLVASGNGCEDSLTIPNFVHIKPPVADFSFKVHCDDHFQVNFINRSIGAQGYLWDFGDGTTSMLAAPLHTYTNTGSFVVSLTASNNNGCSYTKDSIVNVIGKTEGLIYQPQLPEFCKYDTIKFRLTNYNLDLINYLDWNFGDGSGTGPNGRTDSVFHVYTGAGNYLPYLIIRNIYACYDTVYAKNPVKVFGPTASFLVDPAACLDSVVVFNDLSVPYQNYPITTWVWNFGDGVKNTYMGPPFTHVYASAGNYTVILKIKDSKGCYDTSFLFTPIQISKSVLNAGTDTAVCPGDSITLQPSGADTYIWQQNNSLSCTNCTNPVARPNTTTVYYVSGTNSKGCTSQDSVSVEVKQPFTLQLNNADTLCTGTSTTLSASGAELYEWIPSDGSRVLFGSSVNVSPRSNVTYTVIGTDNAGCFSDTGQVVLQVYPYPTISFPNNPVVITAGSQYQIQPAISADANRFLWTPGTGLSCVTCSSPIAQPKSTTTYTLKVSNPGNCSASQSITIEVICKDQQIFIPNTFSPNGDGVNDVFFPRGKGIYSIRSFRIFNRLGQVIFERTNLVANDAANGWNGKYHGKELMSDVYIYEMQVVCDNNQVIPFKGNITLIR